MVKKTKDNVMVKHPEVIITLPKNSDAYIIIITCLRAIKNHNLGSELYDFADHIKKNGHNNLLKSVSDWFTIKFI